MYYTLSKHTLLRALCHCGIFKRLKRVPPTRSPVIRPPYQTNFHPLDTVRTTGKTNVCRAHGKTSFYREPQPRDLGHNKTPGNQRLCYIPLAKENKGLTAYKILLATISVRPLRALAVWNRRQTFVLCRWFRQDLSANKLLCREPASPHGKRTCFLWTHPRPWANATHANHVRRLVGCGRPLAKVPSSACTLSVYFFLPRAKGMHR